MFEQFMKFVALHKPLVIVIVVICFIIAGIVIDKTYDLKVGQNLFSFISGLGRSSGQTENAPSSEAAVQVSPQISPQVSQQVSQEISPKVTLTITKTISQNSGTVRTTIPSTTYSTVSTTSFPEPTTTIPESDTFTTVIVLMFVLTALIVMKTRN